MPEWNIRNGLLLGPLVLTADLILLLGGEVVLDVEGLTDLLGRLALDHVRDSLAADIEEGLNVQVVGSLWNIISGSSEINHAYSPIKVAWCSTHQDNLE